MQGTRNLAHRMGRWSGMHPWKAILGWVAFVLVAFAIGNAVPNHTLGEADKRSPTISSRPRRPCSSRRGRASSPTQSSRPS